MTHEKAKELMWENENSSELSDHIENCEECRKEYETVKRLKKVFASDKDISQTVMYKINLQKRRRFIHRLINACAIVFLSVAVTAIVKFANPGNKFSNNADVESVINESSSTLSVKSPEEISDNIEKKIGDVEDFVSPGHETADKSFSDENNSNDDGKLDDKNSYTKSDESYTDADLYMLLSDYKDSLSLPYHTADIIVMGSDINKALDYLSPIGAIQEEKYIKIDGDAYFEAQKILTDAGFKIEFTTSSESIFQTFIFFADLLG